MNKLFYEQVNCKLEEKNYKKSVYFNQFIFLDIRKVFSDDYLFKYGTPNADMESTGITCGGCGAQLNAKQDFIYIQNK